MSSSLFTDAAFDAAQAMATVADSVKGKPISPQAAAEGIDKLVEVADKLQKAARGLAFQLRTTAHGGNPAAGEQVVDLTAKVVDSLRTAEFEAGLTRDVLMDAHGWLGDVADTVRGTTFTF
jgi:hypothetical protein